MHHDGDTTLHDLDWQHRRWNGVQAYCDSKLYITTFAAAIAQEPPQFASQFLRNSWIIIHIALIFTGYAALFFSFASSLLYILQERNLKAKRTGGVLSATPRCPRTVAR